MKYCKKLFALLAAALLCMALTLPAGAAAPLVRDECGVFDADTLADLEEQAESASDGHDVDVYFLVVDDIGDADQRDYAKNYYISRFFSNCLWPRLKRRFSLSISRTTTSILAPT